jgi:type VI protein secretion system component VasK
VTAARGTAESAHAAALNRSKDRAANALVENALHQLLFRIGLLDGLVLGNLLAEALREFLEQALCQRALAVTSQHAANE